MRISLDLTESHDIFEFVRVLIAQLVEPRKDTNHKFVIRRVHQRTSCRVGNVTDCFLQLLHKGLVKLTSECFFPTGSLAM